ncbi:putative membrane protein [Clostridium argentinense CDC 2741]|uniref:Putative membrane protein n=1 Tax=Clostridium argentinense CDC 2741 TaxID=1418104 RepID=A0A0C1U233_9CLOT|nr:putative membrane protein [Clostridium argentinense CDC 2741]
MKKMDKVMTIVNITTVIVNLVIMIILLSK